VSLSKAGLVGGEQLVGYLQHNPCRRGLLSGLAVTGTVCHASQFHLLQLIPTRLIALTLLIKVCTMVIFYRGYH